MKILFLVIMIFLVGCVVADGPVYYVQSREKHEILQDEYSAKDTLLLKYYSMGARNARVGLGGVRMVEQLPYVDDSVWMNIVEALKKTNLPIVVSETPRSFQIVDWHKKRKVPENFEPVIVREMDKSDTSKLVIVPIVSYYSGWGNELNSGLAAGNSLAFWKIGASAILYHYHVCFGEQSLEVFCRSEKD
jgi:hypothetical protein